MRRKLKLAFIAHESTRKITYNKRKKGLLKKVSELSILCGVPACAIIYGRNDDEPELWPPSPVSVRQVISKFLDMSLMDRSKKMVDQESFIQERVMRADEQLKKLKKENRDKDMTCLMARGMNGLLGSGWLQGLSMLDLTDLEYVADRTLKQTDHMVQEKLNEVVNFDEGPRTIENQWGVVKDENLEEHVLSPGWFIDLTDPPELTMLPYEDNINPDGVSSSNLRFP